MGSISKAAAAFALVTVGFLAPAAFAAAEKTSTDFLSTVPGMGSLLDLTYGSTARLEGSPDPATGAFRDRLFLQGLDGIGATVISADNFRVGFRTRGDVRENLDGNRTLLGSDLLDVGAFGEFTYDEWRVSASIGHGLGESRGGFAGDLGLKWATQFADRWKVEVGPEFSWASEAYVAGLNNFTPRRTPGRGLQLYDPTPGAQELTLSGSVEYSISDSWTVGGMVGAQRVVGDPVARPTDEEINEFFGGVSLGIRF